MNQNEPTLVALDYIILPLYFLKLPCPRPADMPLQDFLGRKQARYGQDDGSFLPVKLVDFWTNIFTALRRPALLSVLMVLPFMILEWINRRNFGEAFPAVLFAFMWLLQTVFILILAPMLRNLAAGNGIARDLIGFAARILSLALLAWLWGSIILDQLPCFLGVPGCD
jgi:hypothetical protein